MQFRGYGRVLKASEEFIEVEVVNIDEKGVAYAYYNGRKIRVKYGIPGDRVRVRPYIVRKGRRGRVKELWGDIIEVISPGIGRIEPKCKHFGLCGGCRFQNWDYKHQLIYKKRLVEEAFKRYGMDVDVEDPLPSPKEYYYRNRMDYPVGIIDDSPVIGLKMVGRWDVVVPLEECHLMSMESIEIINKIREFMSRRGIPPYNIFTHEGFMRYVVIREGKYTGERLISLVTAVGPFPWLDELIDILKEDATGIIWSINPRITDLSIGSEIRPLYGNDHLNEEISGFKFYIHPNAFFQTNSYQTVNLVSLVRELAEGGDVLVDVYSGVGLFSFSLANKYSRVYGIEIDEYSIYSAGINLKRYKGRNITILEGAAEDMLSKTPDEPDTVIVDPPRPGLSIKVKEHLLSLKPKEIIYVSCNPTTLARDVEKLSECYSLDGAVKPIDMFPQTPHIECVVRLIRKT